MKKSKKIINIIEIIETKGFWIFKTIRRTWQMFVNGRLMTKIIYKED